MKTSPPLQDDLRGSFRGRLHLDAPTREVYAGDASPFALMPLGVAVPVDEADLRVLVAYAQETQLPLIARGAGTGLAGEALGSGLIVDLSVHFRSIVAIGSDTVTVQPGVTHAALNAALAPHGRRFAPHPASSATCTLGGMLATNASGGNVYRVGYTRDWVESLRVVWDDGSVDTLPGQTPGSRTIEIRSQTAALLTENRDLILLTRPLTRFNRCGYVLHDVLTSTGLDLVKVLVGSEGTLGFLTEATLRTVPTPGGVCQTVLGFAAVDDAVRAGLTLHSAEGITTCDLLDQRLLALARTVPGARSLVPLPPTIAAALILTFEGDTRQQAIQRGQSALDRLRETTRVALLLPPGSSPAEVDRVQSFRSAAIGGLASLSPGLRPVPGLEDIAVPVEELTRFLAGVRELLKRFDLTAAIHAHVLSGQVHTRPLLDLSRDDERAKLWPLSDAVHLLALGLGGTISTQHGTGLARTPWVDKQYGPIVPVFRELKRIFDPRGILNPGKIVGPDPSRPAWPLREEPLPTPESGSPPAAVSLPVLELLWPKSSPLDVVRTCNGCGDCRTQSVAERMCPVFRATGEETASPRAKAQLARFLLTSTEPRKDAEELWTLANQCVNCKMCRTECRAQVDIPKLMLEVKARLYADYGLARGDWLAARLDGLAALAGFFSLTSNLMLSLRPTRWLLEKWFGLSRQLLVPRLAMRSYLARTRFQRSPGTATHGKVAYFVDTFANRFDPSIGEAAVAVLRHQGFEVLVPRRQRASGMTALAHGDRELARELAQVNVRTLADLIREGYQIVCTEPTAAVALTQDYRHLLDDPDLDLVAANTHEFTAFLWQQHQRGLLKTDFQPLDVTLGHHVPCHVKALGVPAAGPLLLQLIPGVQVRTLDVGCSGMAGTWGLQVSNRDASRGAGAAMLAEFDRPGILFGSTECGACRVQMQDGTRKRTLHPAQYLALALGLMPELAARLARPLGLRVSD